MADRDLLERLDGHMALGNRHMERGNELMDSVREEIRLFRDEIRLSREQHADLRQFIRQENMRAERVTQGMLEELRRLGDTIRGVSTDLQDPRDESRAQREAVLRVFDRLGRDDPA